MLHMLHNNTRVHTVDAFHTMFNMSCAQILCTMMTNPMEYVMLIITHS